MNKTGTVFHIQRFSLQDGPGIRTTVFLKGCNMRCAWCHNPESFSPKPQLSVDFNKCTLCGLCETICEHNVHHISDDIHRLNTKACLSCGKCVSQCLQQAMTIIGETLSAEAVMAVIKKDCAFYRKSGGGVTFSGGEATIQYDFLLTLLKCCKQEGIHTCVETNGAVSSERLASLAEFTDLFLVDFKLADNTLHQKYVGMSNHIVYETLVQLDALKKEVILRCPIIPSINDTDFQFDSIRRVKTSHNNISSVEIMPYHNIGVQKWTNTAMEYSLNEIPVPTQEQITAWNAKVKI